MGSAIATDLEATNDRFSDLQQELKDFALSHGYPGRVAPEAAPVVEFYTKRWIPRVLEWQRFYAANKSWSGSPWEWKHAAEVAEFKAQLAAARATLDILHPAASGQTAPPPANPPHPPPPPPIQSAPVSDPSRRVVSEVYFDATYPPAWAAPPRPPAGGLLGLPTPIVAASALGVGLLLVAAASAARRR